MDNVVQIPLAGRIAAGEPLSLPDSSADFALFGDDTVEIARSMINKDENIYALEVSGTSMIDALINDGDIVLLKPQNYANNGDMVAVLLRDANETTLKRVYFEDEQVRLQPANPLMDPIYVPADNVEIQGKVMMVVRRLG